MYFNWKILVWSAWNPPTREQNQFGLIQLLLHPIDCFVCCILAMLFIHYALNTMRLCKISSNFEKIYFFIQLYFNCWKRSLILPKEDHTYVTCGTTLELMSKYHSNWSYQNDTKTDWSWRIATLGRVIAIKILKSTLN